MSGIGGNTSRFEPPVPRWSTSTKSRSWFRALKVESDQANDSVAEPPGPPARRKSGSGIGSGDLAGTRTTRSSISLPVGSDGFSGTPSDPHSAGRAASVHGRIGRSPSRRSMPPAGSLAVGELGTGAWVVAAEAPGFADPCAPGAHADTSSAPTRTPTNPRLRIALNSGPDADHGSIGCGLVVRQENSGLISRAGLPEITAARNRRGTGAAGPS